MSTTVKTTLPRPVTTSEVPAHVAEQVEVRDGAHAIEVSALFEDAVQEVRHLDNPAGGKTSALTRGVLGSAAASLAGVFMLFTSSYVQVGKEKAAIERGELPAASATPAGGRATDYGAAGLLTFGASALLYGLWRRQSECKDNEFSIGADAQATFKTAADGLPSARFPLVRSTGTDYELLFTSAMRGDVTMEGKTISLADWTAAGRARPSEVISGALATTIPQGARFALEHGNSTFLVNSVARPRQYPVPLRLDWQKQSYTAAVLAGAGLFMGLMFSVPPDPRSLAIDSFLNEHIARIQITPPAPPEEKPTWLDAQKQAESSGGKAHKGPSGKMGSETAPKQERRYQVKGPKDNPNPTIARQIAVDQASRMGVIGVLSSARSAALSSVFSNSSGLGRDATDAIGNLNAIEAGDAYGAGGMGLVGSRVGGGGTGENTIGLGRLPGLGHGPGDHDYGRGVGPKLTKHTIEGPVVGVGPATVIGSLDKEVIRRVIRSHMNQVKFCYESELTRNQKLEGRVQIQFIIGTTGTVMSSVVQASTLGSIQAESCIASAVRRWDFPKPQNGIVSVSYPFVLKTAGE